MASTRNRNTLGDYQAQQRQFEQKVEYNTNKSYGQPQQSYLPGNGLGAAPMCRDALAHNACDVESELFGIGSSNLVEPRAPVKPELKNLKSLDICDKPTTFVVEPRIINKNQRPMYLS